MGSSDVNRSHLPIPDRPRTGLITYDAKDPETKYPPIEQLRPPKGAPNVLVILIDDAGFGASSAFGGPCQTPNAETLAAGGLKYNRFHTTALCSPTRQALLTGRNHHSVGHGRHHRDRHRRAGLLLGAAQHHVAARQDAEAQRLRHGAVRQVPRSAGVGDEPGRPVRRLADRRRRLRVLLRLHRRRGAPVVSRRSTRAPRRSRSKKTPEEGYHFMEDMTDKAIAWIGQQKALMPDKPFFVYFAPGATHAPHHVPKEWADKYKGKFDAGLGQAARRDLRAAEEAGRHPGGLPAHRAPQGDPGLGRRCRRRSSRCCAARWRSTRASWSTPTTTSAGCSTRLKKLGILDDTLVYYIIGDNGASAEGTLNGTFNEMINFNGAGRPRDAGVPRRRGSTSSAGRSPTTTTRWAGRTP